MPAQTRILRAYLIVRTRENRHFAHALDGQNFRAQTIVNIVVAVRNRIGDIGQLRFE